MKGFKNITGHDSIILRMRRAAAEERTGHAYILDGERGIGKRTLANAFAKTLQCESPVTDGGLPDACGKCLSCRVFESGNHPDVLYVTGTKTKSIGVDDVREQIIRPMNVKPFKYRYKIFIVGEAETLTPAAQNALLKTIEEPAPYGIFIFLAAHSQLFLPTVLSRCVSFKLKPLPDETVCGVLTASGMAPDAARICAAFARGNIGKALEVSASEEFAQMRNLAWETVSRIFRVDVVGAFGLYKGFEKHKESVQPLLDMLGLCVRDVIVYASCGTDSVIQRDRLELIREQAAETPLAVWFAFSRAITNAGRALKQNGNFQLTLEAMFLKTNDFAQRLGG